MGGWVVYLLVCANGSVYTGITNNLERRFSMHCKGKGAMYTRLNPPVRMVWSEPHPDRASATRREAEIKRWPRVKKLALISRRARARRRPFLG